MTHVVDSVRRDISDDQTHLHITQLHTRRNEYWTLKDVAASIKAGEPWLLSNGDYTVSIHVVPRCQAPNCSHGPYLQTVPDSPNGDNLENARESL